MGNFNEQYIQLLSKIIKEGYNEPNDRTGVGRRKISSAMIEHDMGEGFPSLTLRKIPPRVAYEELSLFLAGETQTKKLEDQGIYIWSGNTTKEFQKKLNLDHLPEGDMGKLYGYQLRSFDDRFDQLEMVYNSLRDNPSSSRHVCTYYNPNQASEGVLYPCHMVFQFIPIGDHLDLVFYMRSSDVILGLPTNIQFYAFLLKIMAKATGFIPGKVTYMGGDVHIYFNHINAANEMITRNDIRTLPDHPQIEIDREFESIHDFSKLNYEEDVRFVTPYQNLGRLNSEIPVAV